jgi:hypothetical protein
MSSGSQLITASRAAAARASTPGELGFIDYPPRRRHAMRSRNARGIGSRPRGGFVLVLNKITEGTASKLASFLVVRLLRTR